MYVLVGRTIAFKIIRQRIPPSIQFAIATERAAISGCVATVFIVVVAAVKLYWFAGGVSDSESGHGHIMELNHSPDYKQLKLLCRQILAGTGCRCREIIVRWVDDKTTIGEDSPQWTHSEI